MASTFSSLLFDELFNTFSWSITEGLCCEAIVQTRRYPIKTSWNVGFSPGEVFVGFQSWMLSLCIAFQDRSPNPIDCHRPRKKDPQGKPHKAVIFSQFTAFLNLIQSVPWWQMTPVEMVTRDVWFHMATHPLVARYTTNIWQFTVASSSNLIPNTYFYAGNPGWSKSMIPTIKS